MEWAFGDFKLHEERAELTGPDGPVHIERYPLDLLILLIRNADRLVTRDEIIDTVWGGRIVSEATISTAVKQARKAVGDSGSTQTVIKTLHGRGFRFVAPLAAQPPAQPASLPPQPAPQEASVAPQDARLLRRADTPGIGRPSLAVMRFLYLGDGQTSPAIADAIPAELIASLSRMRWLQVIARGSSFRFDPSQAVPEEIGRQLGVRYLLSGSVEAFGDTMTVSVEVLAAADGTLIWSDRFETRQSEIHFARQDIASAVISALELNLPAFEARSARVLSDTQFDAWSHFHLGLREMYRFTVDGNVRAQDHFRAALDLDAHFGRAHSGLSFAHWQTAFLLFGDDRKEMLGRAVDQASRALDIDQQDPFACYNMGRARWLEGDVPAGLTWLDRALDVNPNYAQCHYVRGINMVLSGNASEGSTSVDKAQQLSPLDPLRYGMLACRAMAHISVEEFEEAAKLSTEAMQLPGAHFYIAMIAAAGNELSGNTEEAKRMVARAVAAKPDVSVPMFLQAFPFRSGPLRASMTGAFKRLGLD